MLPAPEPDLLCKPESGAQPQSQQYSAATSIRAPGVPKKVFGNRAAST